MASTQSTAQWYLSTATLSQMEQLLAQRDKLMAQAKVMLTELEKLTKEKDALLEALRLSVNVVDAVCKLSASSVGSPEYAMEAIKVFDTIAGIKKISESI